MSSTARPAAGPVRPAPAAPTGPMRVTQNDLRAAHAEPMVREALDVFRGRIVDVHNNRKRAQPPVAEPDNTENQPS